MRIPNRCQCSSRTPSSVTTPCAYATQAELIWREELPRCIHLALLAAAEYYRRYAGGCCVIVVIACDTIVLLLLVRIRFVMG